MIGARAAGAIALTVAAGAALLAGAARRDPKDLIAITRPAVVIVVVADLVDGQLEVRTTGSGTVVAADGAILTTAHVLDDETRGRPHDLFVIGRSRGDDAEPELVCAGLPAGAMRLSGLDLALLACDRDLNGQPFHAPRWPAVPIGRSESVTPGSQMWVLGFSGLAGDRMQASAGLVSGWTGEQGGAGRRDFMRTDATIAPGTSGGPAVDERGHLIGVATAFRPLEAVRGDVSIPFGQVGLIRPIEHAGDLLLLAQLGFTPRRDQALDLPSDAVLREGAPTAVLVRGRVLDAASGRPVVGAVVAIGRDAAAPSLEHAIAVAISDGDGAFLTDHAVPRGGPYGVAVLAQGFRPLTAVAALQVAPDAAHVFEPWSPLQLARDLVPVPESE